MPLSFFCWSRHRQVFALALPMVLSNITVPLLGLVDTIVIGHLDHAYYLAGVAVGATIISLIFWLLGFLRMSTTGLTAQAVGANDDEGIVQVLAHGLILAGALALAILLLQGPLTELAFAIVDTSAEVQQ